MFSADGLSAYGWHIGAIILGLLHVVIGCAVTVHVLLTKRDVGSATGWIGLAWLSPLFGGALYFILGINRVHRRARAVRERRLLRPRHLLADRKEAAADHLAPLERAATMISGRAALPDNAVEMLHNGDEAYPRMLAAIAAAKQSVALSTYILRDDEAGGPIIDALICAHRRGVAVRVLLDGIGSGYFRSPAFTRLLRGGVKAARFMHSPLPWRMPFLNLRTHKKLLVADGTTAFAGGLNIGAENVLALHPRNPVRDTHFAVAGPVVRQLVAAFAQDWQFATREVLNDDAWWPEPVAAGQTIARTVTSGPDQELERIEFVMIEAISCANVSVAVMTPYFLPEERLITVLATAAMRGVAVDIVIPAHSNHRLVDWATWANIGPLLEAGCRVWRNPPPFEHSKLMVIDGIWGFVGSANWDMRSLRLNFELNLELRHGGEAGRNATSGGTALADDSHIAGELQAHIMARRGQKLTAGMLAARRPGVRLRDAAARLLLPYL